MQQSWWMCSIWSDVPILGILDTSDSHPLGDRNDQVIGPIDWRTTQNTTLRALGSICSATTILFDGVERCGDITVASGGFTDTWRGWYRTKNVTLKDFRTYPIQDLREAEKVRHTVLVDVAPIFDVPHRSYGGRYSYRRGYLMSTFSHFTVSTGRIFSLPLSMTGRTPVTLSSTWTPTRRPPVLAWYCRYRSTPHRLIIAPKLH